METANDIFRSSVSVDERLKSIRAMQTDELRAIVSAPDFCRVQGSVQKAIHASLRARARTAARCLSQKGGQ